MCSLMKDSYINIKEIAEAKGLKSTRSLRLEINKPESKYISREVKVNGGTSYEILFSSLEPEAYNFLGSISIGTLRRWIQSYRKHENADCLVPKYKSTRQGEYNTILDSEMKNILLTLLLHPSQYKIGKAIKLTKHVPINLDNL